VRVEIISRITEDEIKRWIEAKAARASEIAEADRSS
jgi:hypothetical protein